MYALWAAARSIDLSPGICLACWYFRPRFGASIHCFDRQTYFISLPRTSPVIRLTFCFLFDTVCSLKSGRIGAFWNCAHPTRFKEKAYLR